MQEGSIIAGRYRLIRILGKGGMGAVWLAEHLSLKNDVAIKLIDSELANHPEARARFTREAQLAARIKSAHVVQTFDHGVTDDGYPFMAMECLTGMSLRDRLESRKRLSVSETARVVSHVSRALTKAHEAGLVHRDLKPENIFISRAEEEETIKVLDFGVAKATDALASSGVDPTRTGALLGTPYYMSPEQAQGLKSVDSRTDLWALGVVAFECMTGMRPFSAPALGPLVAKIIAGPIPTPTATAPDAQIPPEVDAWMLRALARNPADRFNNAKEAGEAFFIAAGVADSMQRDRASGRDLNRPAAGVSIGTDDSGSPHVITPSSLDPAGLAATMALPNAASAPYPAPQNLPARTLPLSAMSPAAAASMRAPQSVAPLAAAPRPAPFSSPPMTSAAPSLPLAAPGQRSLVPWIVAVVVLAALVGVLAVLVVFRH